MPMPAGVEPRAVCGRCRRPESVCYCRHITPLETQTRVVLLQHPRERDVAIGTARMASLCLPNSELHVGVHWRGVPALERALSDPARPAVLLYPGKGAIDVVQSPPVGPVTLVVVDGTWWQTKKVVRENPQLATLPRYAFTPPTPSEYRIRREPHEAYVSTIEALVHVLGALEHDPARFQSLLVPFRAMIDAQIACEKNLRGARSRHTRVKKRRPRLPSVLRERLNDLVCVVGEANAWPYRCADGADTYPDELIYWVARRMESGETFEFVVAPRSPLAPKTAEYIGIPEETLRRGGTLEALESAWRSFVRDTDIVCAWGHYATGLFASSGGTLPPERLDLRQVARVYAKGKVGTLDDFLARIGSPDLSCWARGRGGVRLGQVEAVAHHLRGVANEPL